MITFPVDKELRLLSQAQAWPGRQEVQQTCITSRPHPCAFSGLVERGPQHCLLEKHMLVGCHQGREGAAVAQGNSGAIGLEGGQGSKVPETGVWEKGIITSLMASQMQLHRVPHTTIQPVKSWAQSKCPLATYMDSDMNTTHSTLKMTLQGVSF